LGIRPIQTLRKLPMVAPKMNENTNSIPLTSLKF